MLRVRINPVTVFASCAQRNHGAVKYFVSWGFLGVDPYCMAVSIDQGTKMPGFTMDDVSFVGAQYEGAVLSSLALKATLITLLSLVDPPSYAAFRP